MKFSTKYSDTSDVAYFLYLINNKTNYLELSEGCKRGERMSQNLSNQIATADWILTKIEKIDPFAIIAGGSPRDWEHGMMARDVDIFLNVPNSWKISVIARQ